MILGSIDWNIDCFKNIEEKYKTNIDEWLCNLYVEIRKRELVDFKEYESKICFTALKPKEKQTLNEK